MLKTSSGSFCCSNSIFTKTFKALINFDFEGVFQDVWPVLWPMIVGCIPFYIVFWLLSFYVFDTALEKVAKRQKRTDK